MSETLTWIGIAFCISQSACLSGLNLAVFSISRLRLEVAAGRGDQRALKVLALRQDGNTTLATILWGNVAVNVLLTLLAESVLAGVAAFLFSTIAITFIGEIFPQAYFSRHALRVASVLSPLLRLYKLLLWPVARPVGVLLNRLIGPEHVPWYEEQELKDMLRYHASSADSEVGRIEAAGAVNFLKLDDLPIREEGEPLDPRSVLPIAFVNGEPDFPTFEATPSDPFLRAIARSKRKWIILVDEHEEPRLALNAPEFLRHAFFGSRKKHLRAFCHRPIVVTNPHTPLGSVLPRLKVTPEGPDDDVIDDDLILLWSENERRIITGSDILGRLFREIALPTHVAPLGPEREAPSPSLP